MHFDRRILDAWSATAHLHTPNPPATADAVAAAERLIGRRLPPAVAEFYSAHDGGHFLSHNVVMLPLHDETELGITQAVATYRGWEWPVPDEVVVIGNDGCGDLFGLWLPDGDQRPLVVRIGAIFEPDCMGIEGQDLNAFLRAYTAFYLLPPDDATTPGLDALGVPDALRFAMADLDDTAFDRILTWASPTFPASLADPYSARLTAADVGRIAAGT